MRRILVAAALLAPALRPAPVFQGSVTASHSSEAVRGCRIRVKQVGAVRLTADLESDADGKFSAAVDLPPGEYRVEITKTNHAGVSMQTRLPLAGPLAVRLTRLGSIAGRVTDAAGRPLGGAHVAPMVAVEGGQFRPFREGGGATVDSGGNYRVHSLPPGNYALAITWASISGAEAPSRPTGAYLYPNNAKPLVFQIAGGTAVTGIDFTVPTESDYSVSGRVTGLDDGKVSSVALVLREQPSLAVVMKRTEGDGTFRFDRVAPGSYELRAAGPSSGYAGWGATLDPKPRFGQRQVDLGGQSLAGVDVGLDSARSVKLSLDATPECRTNSSPTVRIEPLEQWGALLSRDVELTPERETQVDDLAPVRYGVTVTKAPEGCYGVARTVVDARSGAGARIAIARGGSVQGRVEGAATLVTLSNLDDPTQPEQAATLDKGAFGFYGLRPGRYRVRAADTVIEVVVRANARTDALLRIEEKRP
jgi:hypothetical protein